MNKILIKECCYCVREFNLVPNNEASHGACKRHWIEMMSSLTGRQKAIDRANDIENKGGEFCPDKADVQNKSCFVLF
jgi:hypothetical protein